MNFIIELSITKNRKNAILNVMNQLFKKCHYIRYYNWRDSEYVDLLSISIAWNADFDCFWLQITVYLNNVKILLQVYENTD